MKPNPNRPRQWTQGPWPRYLNAAIGTWVFISAFAWPHSYASRTNTWIIGFLTVVTSLWAVKLPALRFANNAFAIWLFVPAISEAHISPATFWNNVIAAIALLVISLIPSGRVRAPTFS